MKSPSSAVGINKKVEFAASNGLTSCSMLYTEAPCVVLAIILKRSSLHGEGIVLHVKMLVLMS